MSQERIEIVPISASLVGSMTMPEPIILPVFSNDLVVNLI